MAEEETRRVSEALDAIAAISDPVRRARATSEVLADLKRRSPQLTEDRRQTVRQRRSDGLSIRAIAAEVGLSPGAVQDILRGHAGSWGKRPKPEDTP